MIYEDHVPTTMPAPASRVGSPFARLLLLRNGGRLTPFEYAEVESMIRCLERDLRASLSAMQMARLAEIEGAHES